MGLYEQAVSADIEQHEQMMQSLGGPDRFSVENGKEDVPIFILRHPLSRLFCSPALKRYYITDIASTERKIVGVVPALPEGADGYKPTLLDRLRVQAEEDGTLYAYPDALKELLRGSIGYDALVIDMTAHTALLAAIQTAQQTNNTAQLQQLQANFEAVVLKEPIKLWTMSRTVYNAITRAIVDYSKDNGGVVVDPTDPRHACILKVSKIKGTNNRYQYKVRWWWQAKFQLPEALFEGAGGSVKKMEDYYADHLREMAQYPDTRVMDLLVQANCPLGPGAGTALPEAQQPTATAALPQASTPPAALPAAPQMPPELAAAPAPMPAPVVQPSQLTVSAADLPCFGKTPNMGDTKCQQCPRSMECLQAMQEAMQKARAMTAPAPAAVPPAPAPTPTAPATDAEAAVQAKVQAALAQARKITGQEG